LVDEIIARVQSYHIVRVRGTPASGKTTLMNLVANELLERYGKTTPIHQLAGWKREEVWEANGWQGYLQQKTGVKDWTWGNYQAYLLLDEAQESYCCGALWAGLFKGIEPIMGYPFIILFTSYSTPGRGHEGYWGEKYIPVPMSFAPAQEIALRPEESISDVLTPLWSVEHTEMRIVSPVGLLLDEDEAIDIVTGYAQACIQPTPSLSAGLKKTLFRISNGHAGLLTDLVSVLQDVPEIYALVQRNILLDSQTTSKHLFGRPLEFFERIHDYPFTKGLPKSTTLLHSATARVFKKAIAEDGISGCDLMRENEEFQEAHDNIWRNGWLHAERSKPGYRYVFATQIHRW
jgi:hypothetical protein